LKELKVKKRRGTSSKRMTGYAEIPVEVPGVLFLKKDFFERAGESKLKWSKGVLGAPSERRGPLKSQKKRIVPGNLL